MPLKIANSSLALQIGTIPVWVGSVWSNSDYKAISASQQSWSLGLAELGNKDLPAVLIRVKAELKTRQLNRNSMKSD